jgi:hypothetical protein
MDMPFLDRPHDKNALPPDVPEGYFAQFPDRLMTRLHEENAESKSPAMAVSDRSRQRIGYRGAAVAALLCGAMAYLFWPRAENANLNQADPLAQLQQEAPESLLAYLEEHAQEYPGVAPWRASPPDTNMVDVQRTSTPLPSAAELKRIDVLAELDRLDPNELEDWFEQHPQELDAALDDE